MKIITKKRVDMMNEVSGAEVNQLLKLCVELLFSCVCVWLDVNEGASNKGVWNNVKKGRKDGTNENASVLQCLFWFDVALQGHFISV